MSLNPKPQPQWLSAETRAKAQFKKELTATQARAAQAEEVRLATLFLMSEVPL